MSRRSVHVDLSPDAFEALVELVTTPTPGVWALVPHEVQGRPEWWVVQAENVAPTEREIELIERLKADRWSVGSCASGLILARSGTWRFDD